MPRLSLRSAAAIAALALLAAAAVALSLRSPARAAIVIYKDIVLEVDGGFQPQTLPRDKFAPIDFQGNLEVGSRSGRQPQALREAVVWFSSAGRLDVTGLPTCAASQVADLGTAEARAVCGAAMVGDGTLEAQVGGVHLTAPLTIFNGPEEDGHPTAVVHTRLGAPAEEVFAIPVPIERIAGRTYRYRVTLTIPSLAAGLGSLTRIDVDIGRRYRFDGAEHSYVSARCREPILRTRGRFTFADGTAVEGSVEKFCRAD